MVCFCQSNSFVRHSQSKFHPLICDWWLPSTLTCRLSILLAVSLADCQSNSCRLSVLQTVSLVVLCNLPLPGGQSCEHFFFYVIFYFFLYFIVIHVSSAGMFIPSVTSANEIHSKSDMCCFLFWILVPSTKHRHKTKTSGVCKMLFFWRKSCHFWNYCLNNCAHIWEIITYFYITYNKLLRKMQNQDVKYIFFRLMNQEMVSCPVRYNW